MIINHSREKLINLIVYFVQKTKHCGKTKLFKLLYFADFTSFKKTGKSITGLTYYTWPKGPVAVTLFNELKSPDQDFSKTFSITKSTYNDMLNIVPKHGVKFDEQYFNKIELKIINDIAYVFRDALAEEMSEITHLKNSPWDKTSKTKGKNKPIDYLLAFDDDKDSLSIDEYWERKKENDTIDSIISSCKKGT